MMVLIVVVVLDCCPCVALGAELRWSVVALGAVLRRPAAGGKFLLFSGSNN